MVPAGPTAHLIVPQTHLSLSLLQQFFHAMPRPMHPRDLPTPCLVRIGERVPRLRLRFTTLEYRHPLARPDVAVLILGLHRRQQHPHPQRSLGTIAHLDFPSASRRLPRRPPIHTLTD